MSTQETGALIESVNNMTAAVAGKMGEIDERVDKAEREFEQFKTEADKRYCMFSRDISVDTSLSASDHELGRYQTLDSAIKNNPNVDMLRIKLSIGVHVVNSACTFYGKKLSIIGGGNKDNTSLLFTQTGLVNDNAKYEMQTNGIYVRSAQEVFFKNVKIVTPSLPDGYTAENSRRIGAFGGCGVFRYWSFIDKIHLYNCHVEINDSPIFAVFGGYNDPTGLSIYGTSIDKKKDIKFIHTNNGVKPKLLTNLHNTTYISNSDFSGTEDSDFFDVIFVS